MGEAEIVARWRDIVTRETGREPRDVDEEHSRRGGLLAWMLCGEEPLPQPPPRYFSRPFHQLIRAGRAHGLQASDPEGFAGDDGRRLVFIGGTAWTVEKEIDNGYIVTHEGAPCRWLLVREWALTRTNELEPNN